MVEFERTCLEKERKKERFSRMQTGSNNKDRFLQEFPLFFSNALTMQNSNKKKSGIAIISICALALAATGFILPPPTVPIPCSGWMSGSYPWGILDVWEWTNRSSIMRSYKDGEMIGEWIYRSDLNGTIYMTAKNYPRCYVKQEKYGGMHASTLGPDLAAYHRGKNVTFEKREAWAGNHRCKVLDDLGLGYLLIDAETYFCWGYEDMVNITMGPIEKEIPLDHFAMVRDPGLCPPEISVPPRKSDLYC